MKRKKLLFALTLMVAFILAIPGKVLAEGLPLYPSIPERYYPDLKEEIISNLEMNYSSFANKPEKFTADYRIGNYIPWYNYNPDGEKFIKEISCVVYPVYAGEKMVSFKALDPSGEPFLNYGSGFIAEPLGEYVQSGHSDYFLINFLTNVFAASEGKVQFISWNGAMVMNGEAVYKDEIEKLEDSKFKEDFLDWYKEYKALDGAGDVSNEKKLQDLSVKFLEAKLKESSQDFAFNRDMEKFSSLPIIYKGGSEEIIPSRAGTVLPKPDKLLKDQDEKAPPTGDPFFMKRNPTQAVEISSLRKNQSIYAVNQNEILNAIEKDQGYLSKTLATEKIAVTANTITPVYKASLYDYAETGNIEIQPLLFDNAREYAAEVNRGGRFAGIILFTFDGISIKPHIYGPNDDPTYSFDWQVNVPRIQALLMKVHFSSDDIQAKLVFMDGLGYVYDIRGNGQEVLIAAGSKLGTEINPEISMNFTPVMEEALVVDENLRELAKKEKAERDRRMEKIKNLPKGQNPDTGNSAPAPFIVDNSPYRNENIYTVKRGDSLWKIAARYLGKGSRYGEIKKINGLKSNTIYPGQRLRIR